MARTEEHATATFRIPPAWTPDDPSYSFQDWKTDIVLWRAATDIPEAKQGAAVAQRISGVTGKNFIRFACEATNVADIQIINGDGRPKVDPITGRMIMDAEGNPVMRSGIDVLMEVLEARWGQEMQVTQLKVIDEWDRWCPNVNESPDSQITDFYMKKSRAQRRGGIETNYVYDAWKLLKCYSLPSDDWALLLQPTAGLLPYDEATFNAFVTRLKRHLNLHFSKAANIVNPRSGGRFHTNTAEEQTTQTSCLFTPGMSSSSTSQSFYPSSEQCLDQLMPAQAFNSLGEGDNDDIEVEAVESDEDSDDELEFGDQEQEAHAAYLEYETAMALWDNSELPAHLEDVCENFLMRAQRWNKFRKFGRKRRHLFRRTPGHPKFRRPDGTPRRFVRKARFKFAPRRRRTFAAGTHINPKDKNGNVMKCSICGSENHLRAYCPQKPKKKFGKGKGQGKGSHNKGTNTHLADNAYVEDNPLFGLVIPRVQPHVPDPLATLPREAPPGLSPISSITPAPSHVSKAAMTSVYQEMTIWHFKEQKSKDGSQTQVTMQQSMNSTVTSSSTAPNLNYTDAPTLAQLSSGTSPQQRERYVPQIFFPAMMGSAFEKETDPFALTYLEESEGENWEGEDGNSSTDEEATYQLSTQLGEHREGLLVDTGAAGNLTGNLWRERQELLARKAGKPTLPSVKRERPLRIDGVGTGGSEAHEDAQIPVSIGGVDGIFQSPVVYNPPTLPALLGLESMERKRAIIDTAGRVMIFPPEGKGIKMHLPKGTILLHLEKSKSGHLMLPCSDFRITKKKKKKHNMFTAQDELTVWNTTTRKITTSSKLKKVRFELGEQEPEQQES